MKKNGRLYRIARQPQHHRAIGCPGGADEVGREKNAAGAGPAGQENEMGRPALAHAFDGATRRHEHGSIRGFLLRRLHARLPKTAARHESAQGADGKNRSREIKGPGTDLRFSIKGISAVICGGDRNIPDGEVFSCPVQGFGARAMSLLTRRPFIRASAFDNIRLEISRRENRRSDEQSNRKAEQDSRFRSGRALHRRILARL